MIGSPKLIHSFENTPNLSNNVYSAPSFIPVPPQTPAPRSISNIDQDIKTRFVGILWVSKEPDQDISEYFSEYDHWEKYSETKGYSKRPYFFVYKDVMRKYQNYLCILENEDGIEEYYVVAKKMKTELEELEKFCPCLRCRASIINPLKYLFCPYCTKCITSGQGFAKQEYVDKARENKNSLEKVKKSPPSRYSRLFLKIEPLKLLEMITIAMLIILAIYKLY